MPLEWLFAVINPLPARVNPNMQLQVQRAAARPTSDAHADMPAFH